MKNEWDAGAADDVARTAAASESTSKGKHNEIRRRGCSLEKDKSFNFFPGPQRKLEHFSFFRGRCLAADCIPAERHDSARGIRLRRLLGRPIIRRRERATRSAISQMGRFSFYLSSASFCSSSFVAASTRPTGSRQIPLGLFLPPDASALSDWLFCSSVLFLGNVAPMTRTSCGISNEMEADSRLPLDSVERPVEKEGKKVGRRETASGGRASC